MGKLCGCVLAVALLFGLSGAVESLAHAAVVKGTATGTITVDGNGSGSLYGNVQKGQRVERGHVTLDVASAEAEFNTGLRRLERVGTEGLPSAMTISSSATRKIQTAAPISIAASRARRSPTTRNAARRRGG